MEKEYRDAEPGSHDRLAYIKFTNFTLPELQSEIAADPNLTDNELYAFTTNKSITTETLDQVRIPDALVAENITLLPQASAAALNRALDAFEKDAPDVSTAHRAILRHPNSTPEMFLRVARQTNAPDVWNSLGSSYSRNTELLAYMAETSHDPSIITGLCSNNSTPHKSFERMRERGVINADSKGALRALSHRDPRPSWVSENGEMI